MEEKGWVTFVGAGPGNPDLLTIGGKRALESGEVILYDRLVGPGILAMMPRTARLIDVGKSSHNHKVSQEGINQLILKYARAGKKVVRLKGGDSYLFGRGGEEIVGLYEAGLPFSVIPGVTSAISVPAFSGIPVTHRDFSSSLHIFTGHRKEDGSLNIPYKEAVTLGGTLVFLMGISALPEICQGLIAGGMEADKPAALIENGTMPGQRTLVSTIRELPGKAAGDGFSPPSVLIIGETVRLHASLDFIPFLPLWGREVLVVSSMKTGGRLSAGLRQYGCSVIEQSCLQLEPDKNAGISWSEIDRYSWLLFTSAFGVDCFMKGLKDNRIDFRRLGGIKIGAIGRITAKVLEQYGIYPDFVPVTFDGKGMAEGISEHLTKADKVLIYRARGGTPEIPSMLIENGISFDDVAAYEAVYKNDGDNFIREKLEQRAFDLLTFTSTSGVEGFVRSVDKQCYEGQSVLCIGRQTAAAAEKYGMIAHTSCEATVDSMIAWILRALGGTKDE